MAKPKCAVEAGAESIRAGLSEECIRLAFLDNHFYVKGRFLEVASPDDKYKTMAYTVRDRMLHRWVSTIRTYQQVNPRTVCYLSAEYLPGPFLGNNLLNLGIEEPTRKALAGLGIDLDELIEHEEEPGLGNGGLGRFAACFMDSLATLQISAISYGIRYEFGIFTQAIRDGKQVETTDNRLRYGNPWEVRRPNVAYEVTLGGHTEQYLDEQDRFRVRWVPGGTFHGVAIDTPILDHGVSTGNLLRLWSAEAAEDFDFHAFNRDDYYGAVTRRGQHDPYLLCADYAGYIACQDQASAAYRDTANWTRMSILNVARMGKFSSDRTIAEYCRDIWRVTPTPVEL